MSLVCPSFIVALGPDLCRPVDHYCERASAAITAEPINFLSNIAFLVAGYFAWRLMKQQQGDDAGWLIKAIVLTIPIVGLGSMLFHSLGRRWSEWGDVIPILIFILFYFWLIFRRVLRWPAWAAALGLVGFLGVTIFLESGVPGDVLWGGAMYLPTMVVLLALGLRTLRRNPVTGRTFLIAVGVFLLSFTARALDEPLCPLIPFGTHFVWHLLNATLLYMLATIAITYKPRAQASSG